MSQSSSSVRERVQEIHEYGVDIKNFVIYLQGVEEDNPSETGAEPGIEFRMANRFIKNLDILSGVNESEAIIVSMKTGGGDWEEGMAMYDAIKTAPNPVTIINYSQASSMSSIILQAANKRVMMPHSHFMYHEGSLGSEGTYKQVLTAVEYSKYLYEQMIEIYVNSLKNSAHGDKTRWGRPRIRKYLIDMMSTKEEVYLLAEDAVKSGFADEVFTKWDTITDYTDEQLGRK